MLAQEFPRCCGILVITHLEGGILDEFLAAYETFLRGAYRLVLFADVQGGYGDTIRTALREYPQLGPCKRTNYLPNVVHGDQSKVAAFIWKPSDEYVAACRRSRAGGGQGPQWGYGGAIPYRQVWKRVVGEKEPKASEKKAPAKVAVRERAR